MNSNVKVAPNSKESEMMILGCMLNSVSALNIACESLDDSDFFYAEHKIVFQVLKSAYKNDKPADVHLVCEELRNQDKLKSVGGPAYITMLAQYVGTSAYIDEYVARLKNKTALRELIAGSNIFINKALEEPENFENLLEEHKNLIKRIESNNSIKIPLLTAQERLEEQNKFLLQYRGQQYLGLLVKTVDEFNENLLGLRKLILLAAAPNVGKTALTIQLAIEVLQTNPDACLAYFSLEMPAVDIFRRLNLYLAEMSFRDFVFGTGKRPQAPGQEAYFTENELNKLKKAEEQILEFGKRLQIIDSSTVPYIDSRTIVNYIEEIKRQTGCKRVIVVIDYLQVWPIPQKMGFSSDLEADKWRIGEMKKIRDAINDDPVIVVSEARKPSDKDDIWGGDMSDVMGTARNTYTPDVVTLLSILPPKTIGRIWRIRKLPEIPIDEEYEEIKDKDEKAGVAIIPFLASNGISICKLKVPKCRDGMERFNVLYQFNFRKNKFTKVCWNEIENLAEKYKIVKPTYSPHNNY